MLPHEEENRNDIIQTHGVLLCNATSAMNFALRLAEAVQRRDTYNRFTRAVLIGILVREARKLRAVAILCERGFVSEAQQIARSIFDGLLAALFIVREPIAPHPLPPNIKRVAFPPIPDGMNAMDHRANVYAGHLLAQKYKKCDGNWAKSNVPPEVLQRIRDRAQDMFSLIGPQWAEMIGTSKGYSGMRVIDQAAYYGLADHYDGYMELSNVSHANDAFDVLEFGEDYTYIHVCGKVKGIDSAIKLASGYLLTTCAHIAEAMGLPEFIDEGYLLAKAIAEID